LWWNEFSFHLYELQRRREVAQKGVRISFGKWTKTCRFFDFEWDGGVVPILKMASDPRKAGR